MLFRSVSETMPISTGLQLIGTSLVGVVIFGEWGSTSAKIWGFIGIALLIIGAILTSVSDSGTSEGNKSNQTGTIIMLVCTTLGFIVYNAIPRALSASGIAIFFPESVGMVLAVLVYLVFTRQLGELKAKSSWQSLIAGFIFSIAALGYIMSVRDNGVNTAFVVSQLSVVISTLHVFLFLFQFGYLILVGLYLVFQPFDFKLCLIELKLNSFYVVCNKLVAFLYRIAVLDKYLVNGLGTVVFYIRRLLRLNNSREHAVGKTEL